MGCVDHGQREKGLSLVYCLRFAEQLSVIGGGSEVSVGNLVCFFNSLNQLGYSQTLVSYPLWLPGWTTVLQDITQLISHKG